MQFVFSEFALEIDCCDLDKTWDLNGCLKRSTHTILHGVLAETVEHDLQYTIYSSGNQRVWDMLS